MYNFVLLYICTVVWNACEFSVLAIVRAEAIIIIGPHAMLLKSDRPAAARAARAAEAVGARA